MSCRRLRRLPRRSIGGPPWAASSHRGRLLSTRQRGMRYGADVICPSSVSARTSQKGISIAR
jgi:hypothetical protein